MRKVGIVVDDYKLDAFKKAINEAGFTNVESNKFINKTHTIVIYCEETDVETVRRLCVKLQHQIKRGSN